MRRQLTVFVLCMSLGLLILAVSVIGAIQEWDVIRYHHTLLGYSYGFLVAILSYVFGKRG